MRPIRVELHAELIALIERREALNADENMNAGQWLEEIRKVDELISVHLRVACERAV